MRTTDLLTRRIIVGGTGDLLRHQPKALLVTIRKKMPTIQLVSIICEETSNWISLSIISGEILSDDRTTLSAMISEEDERITSSQR